MSLDEVLNEIKTLCPAILTLLEEALRWTDLNCPVPVAVFGNGRFADFGHEQRVAAILLRATHRRLRRTFGAKTEKELTAEACITLFSSITGQDEAKREQAPQSDSPESHTANLDTLISDLKTVLDAAKFVTMVTVTWEGGFDGNQIRENCKVAIAIDSQLRMQILPSLSENAHHNINYGL
jgi:hypothetical protein